MANLIGKNVLIVDEVDDTRTTLEYAVRELEKDVELAQKSLGREGEKTTFSIFVLHVSYSYISLLRSELTISSE
jgi:hypoxanthine phosphoribosyltransferase